MMVVIVRVDVGRGHGVSILIDEDDNVRRCRGHDIDLCHNDVPLVQMLMAVAVRLRGGQLRESGNEDSSLHVEGVL